MNGEWRQKSGGEVNHRRSFSCPRVQKSGHIVF
jgi:hypothetical protein